MKTMGIVCHACGNLFIAEYEGDEFEKGLTRRCKHCSAICTVSKGSMKKMDRKLLATTYASLPLFPLFGIAIFSKYIFGITFNQWHSQYQSALILAILIIVLINILIKITIEIPAGNIFFIFIKKLNVEVASVSEEYLYIDYNWKCSCLKDNFLSYSFPILHYSKLTMLLWFTFKLPFKIFGFNKNCIYESITVKCNSCGQKVNYIFKLNKSLFVQYSTNNNKLSTIDIFRMHEQTHSIERSKYRA